MGDHVAHREQSTNATSEQEVGAGRSFPFFGDRPMYKPSSAPANPEHKGCGVFAEANLSSPHSWPLLPLAPGLRSTPSHSSSVSTRSSARRSQTSGGRSRQRGSLCTPISGAWRGSTGRLLDDRGTFRLLDDAHVEPRLIPRANSAPGDLDRLIAFSRYHNRISAGNVFHGSLGAFIGQ